MALGRRGPRAGGAEDLRPPLLPGIANFDDLDPLKLEPRSTRAGAAGRPPPPGGLVVLPGSKTTIADLAALRREAGTSTFAHVRQGGPVLGLCGGYQMLGRSVADPRGSRGRRAARPGSACSTSRRSSTGDKLRPVTGLPRRRRPLLGLRDAPRRDPRARPGPPAAALRRRPRRGAVSPDGRVSGCYVHGLFADDRQRAAWLAGLSPPSALGYEAAVDRTLDDLAAHLARHIDLDGLLELAR